MAVPPPPDGLVATLERARALGFLGPGPVERHIEHAGAFVAALTGVTGTVIDLGSGGGVPGLVIAAVRPDLELVLVDATGARCRVLEEAVHRLGLSAQVVQGRAEALGRGPWRGQADAVVARSFGRPAVTAECAAPFLRVGGILVVSEPPEPVPERWPAAGLALLGLRRRSAPGVSPVVLEQYAACSADYPRREGIPAKRPLF